MAVVRLSRLDELVSVAQLVNSLEPAGRFGPESAATRRFAERVKKKRDDAAK